MLDFIAECVDERRTAVVGNQNLHSIHLSRSDAGLRRFYERADVIEIDSMPLVYWGKLLGLKTSRQNRATYLDWRDEFWRLAQVEGWRVFLLGAAPDLARTAADRLAREFPGVVIGAHHGYFDRSPGAADNDLVVRTINDFRPDVVLVGMGMPIQELWIEQNINRLRSGVALSIGAAIDYEAGAQPPAPRFLGDLGVEWLYRLLRDPRRLWRRYLVEPWSLLGAVWRDLWRRPRVAAAENPHEHVSSDFEPPAAAGSEAGPVASTTQPSKAAA